MKAVAFKKGSAVRECDALYDIECEGPYPAPRDLLVRVNAVSVNPLDTKVRGGLVAVPDAVKVLGWDASGIVEAVGTDVSMFKPGDAVYYAGSFHRSGSNADFHLVDERIAGPKPERLTFAQAAALPLATLTAWQLLFERLQVAMGSAACPAAGVLLIVGGAGGVGSMLIQLARQLTSLTVIATASRKDSHDWCKRLGAHYVIDHRRLMAPQIAALGIPNVTHVTHVASLTHTAEHLPDLVELLAPHGKLGVIDDHTTFDAASMKAKSLSLHWEMVFTRPALHTPDLVVQHHILEKVANLVDEGVLQSPLSRSLSPLNAASLREAHRLIEAGEITGKVVVAR